VSGLAVALPDTVPSGYATGRERGADMVALPSVIGLVREAVAAAGTLHAWAAAAGGRSFTGRGAAHAVETPHGTWVVRHYHRGGAVARLLGDRYLAAGEPRPLRELRASSRARARGVPTPEVVAAVIYPAGLFYRADLATAYVAGASDLADAVLGPSRAEPAGRALAWRAAGALLRLAFDAGVRHADLNLRNILVRSSGGAVDALLLDLDRAEVGDAPVSDDARAAMLRRLHRSRRKLESAAGVEASATELAAFRAGLEGADG
jgi:3-deoxy-D-manno-octulosonic acid kinase